MDRFRRRVSFKRLVAHLWHFGVFDSAGFAKDAAAYYRSWWRNDSAYLHILPTDWNSPVAVGQPIDVVPFSAADTAELVVNGASLGKKRVPSLGVVRYDGVPFHPGRLEACAWDVDGHAVANATVATTQPPAAIRLILDDDNNRPICADGQDVAWLRVEIVDEAGLLVPSAGNALQFSVAGSGATIYGVANGDPTDHDKDKGTVRRAYKGLARVIVRAGTVPGSVVLTAKSPGLKTATFQFTTRTAE